MEELLLQHRLISQSRFGMVKLESMFFLGVFPFIFMPSLIICFCFFRFLKSLRGHVKSVYQVSWSADNRLLSSGSADSTLKVWDISKGTLLTDLPGHADEVYALDWAPDGERVASGGKDRIMKLWRK